MSHLLIIELPDGGDTDIVQAALAHGDEFTFLCAELAPYGAQPAVIAALAGARGFIEVPGFEPAEVERRALAAHAQRAFDGVLCLVAHRLVAAARLARRLGLPHLNPQSAQRLVDRSAGAAAPGARLIACDVFTRQGQHRLLGVHDPLHGAPGAPASRGSTFTPCGLTAGARFAALQAYVSAELDAVGFDCGASHVQIQLSDAGPRLIRLQPHLAGAKLARLIGYALGRSVHADLIALHTGQALAPSSGAAPQVAVLRWIVADREAVLDEVVLPPWQDPAIRCVEIIRQPGERIRPPPGDVDRLGYVVVCGPSRGDAESLADRFVARTLVRLHPAPPGLESQAPPVGTLGSVVHQQRPDLCMRR